MYGIAVSQDLLKSGIVQYGDVLSIPGLGLRVVNDAMGPTKCVHRNAEGRCVKRVPQTRAVDLMVFSFEEEHRIGVRHLSVTRLRQTQGESQWNINRTPQRNLRQIVEPVRVNAIQPSDTTVHLEPR